MANTLLTVNNREEETPHIHERQYFQIHKLFRELLEYSEHDEKLGLTPSAKQEIARQHLGAVSYEDIFNEDEEVNGNPPFRLRVQDIAQELINSTINSLNAISKEDLEKYLKEISNKYDILESSFQTHKDSANKKFDALDEEFEGLQTEVFEEVAKQLKKYYSKDDTYSKKEIDKKLKNNIEESQKGLIKADGSVCFQKPIAGKDPQSMTHLTTKRYVEQRAVQHENDPEAHDIGKKLDKIVEKYTRAIAQAKGETYTRTQIDKIINTLVESKVKLGLSKVPTFSDLNNIKYKLESDYVKNDGSTPFYSPQSGEDAVEDKQFVTLRQLQEAVEELKKLNENQQCYWITSGDIETTVGFFEDNETPPAKMTVQEVLDRIFYQRKVSMDVPDVAVPGSYVDVTVCVNNPYEIDHAELLVKSGNGEWETAKKDNVIVGSFERSDFEEQLCITVTVGPIKDDTEFDFVIYKSDGTEEHETSKTKMNYPVFAGVVPHYQTISDLSYYDLKKLCNSDPNNNQFYDDKTEYMMELEHTYSFESKYPMKLIVAVPTNYRDLYKIQNDVQTFGAEDFDKTSQVSFSIGDKAIQYKIYTYKQHLTSFNSDVTFKFN